VAIEQLQTAIRLSPLDPKAALNYGIGIARFFQGHLDEAITIMLTALQELPSHAGIYRYLASCYAHAGRLEDAQAIVRRLRDLTPDVIPNVVQWRRPEHRELFLSGLRQAMGEPEAGTLLPRARFG
jgi:adenylate cyclase